MGRQGPRKRSIFGETPAGIAGQDRRSFLLVKAGSSVTDGKLPGKQGTCKDRYRLGRRPVACLWCGGLTAFSPQAGGSMYSQAMASPRE